MPRPLKDSGFAVVLLALFALSIGGQRVTGWHFSNEQTSRHRQLITALAG